MAGENTSSPYVERQGKVDLRLGRSHGVADDMRKLLPRRHQDVEGVEDGPFSWTLTPLSIEAVVSE